uniref:Transketolase N-terminal domain-containing protein n=1 Tax=Ananas comosus var. bracteatus TaxID=296719 RepID=A0A6V7PV21_ANACO|nr:unnamed protein product [Ananas comosus var. bracteatus]
MAVVATVSASSAASNTISNPHCPCALPGPAHVPAAVDAPPPTPKPAYRGGGGEAPQGCAPTGHVLYDNVMRFNPKNTYRFNRNRFVLSVGTATFSTTPSSTLPAITASRSHASPSSYTTYISIGLK